MLTITPTDFDWTIAMLSDLEKQQVPFALALGTNRTIEEVQAAIQKHERETYTIRRDWVVQGIKIDNADRATKDKPIATVHLDPARAFMSKFEDGDEKTPMGHSIVIPIEARRTKSDIVQKSQRPKALHFTTGASSRLTRTTVYRGDKRTFMIQRPDGSGAIFQRVGTGVRKKREKANADRIAQGLKPLHRDPSLRLLYILRPKAPTPANLDFYQVGEDVVRDRYLVNVSGFLAYALRTAK